ncbi:hypothetical protein NFI96_033206 [Prochilodus magdalenae]|nr:hypothetical protein NFI96_033206 [Prochilodus magdalenae]
MDLWYFTICISLVMTMSISKTTDCPKSWPAHIFGKASVRSGESLLLKCSIFDMNRYCKEFHMYLCKNGIGMKIELLQNKDHYVFTLRNVSPLDSGNYSCVYSLNKYPPKNMTADGQNSIQVQVTGDAPTGSVEIALASVAVILLAGLICVGIYLCRGRILNECCHNEGRSEWTDGDLAIYENGHIIKTLAEPEPFYHNMKT